MRKQLNPQNYYKIDSDLNNHRENLNKINQKNKFKKNKTNWPI